jgi:hypothetical protein
VTCLHGDLVDNQEKYIVNIRKRLPTFPAVNDSGT